MATKKRKPAAKSCNCLKLADEQLREKRGATFKQELMMDFDAGKASLVGPLLAVEWAANRRGKGLPVVMCAYCPFCGKEKKD